MPHFELAPRAYQFSLVGSTTGGSKQSAKRRKAVGSATFKPGDGLVVVARRRIIGYVNRQGGCVELPEGCNVTALASGIAPKLYRRGSHELGALRQQELSLTALAALVRMLNTGEAVLSDGYFALRPDLVAKPRQHKQKYRRGHRMQSAA